MSIHHRSNLTAWALALALFMPASAQAALVTAAGQGADERRALHETQTLAGDGGKQLSGGERQRISLARAILKSAPIVVLDEATAFMDPENEEKMNEAIAEVIEGKTVIVIAHRLHSTVSADQICVLDQGNLSDCGTHEQLLARCEPYQKLWSAAESSARWKVSAKEGGDAQ